MTDSRGTMVIKHEGELELFERSKLRRCLAAAMKAGGRDPHLADALARAVEIHLVDGWDGKQPPTTEHVFRCVQTALTETGLAPVARALSRHRRGREGRRSGLLVTGASNSRRNPTPWRKSMVADLLENRHGLGRPVARILAGEVESRVLSLGYSVVTARLIVELVRSELAAWGFGREAIDDAQRGVDAFASRPTTKEN